MNTKLPARRRLVVVAAAIALSSTAGGLAAQNAPVTPEDSVRVLEEARRQAVLSADTVALASMVAPEFTEISRLGTLRTRAENLRDVAEGTLKLTTIRQDSLTVRIYGDVAILQGIVFNAGTFRGFPFQGRLRYTRVFVRREGRWQAVLMQQTPMQ